MSGNLNLRVHCMLTQPCMFATATFALPMANAAVPMQTRALSAPLVQSNASTSPDVLESAERRLPKLQTNRSTLYKSLDQGIAFTCMPAAQLAQPSKAVQTCRLAAGNVFASRLVSSQLYTLLSACSALHTNSRHMHAISNKHGSILVSSTLWISRSVCHVCISLEPGKQA